MTEKESAVIQNLDYVECLQPGCESPKRWKDLCATHGNQLHKGISPILTIVEPCQQCSVSHCVRSANSMREGAMCNSHYQRQYRGLDPEAKVLPPVKAVCWAGECNKPAETKRLCGGHYKLAKSGGLEVPNEFGIQLNPACSYGDCGRVRTSKMYCRGHTSQAHLGQELTPLRPYGVYVSPQKCEVDACHKAVTSAGLCGNHGRKRSTYGLSIAQMSTLQAVTECENPGCKNSAKLCVDHDHGTGKVRGMLCNGCNTSLGSLGDSRERISGLVLYLDSNRSHG